jgi:hypothetical protein
VEGGVVVKYFGAISTFAAKTGNYYLKDKWE